MAMTVIVGQIFSYVALAFGIFFFIFASKYYIAVLLALFGSRSGSTNGNGNPNNNKRGRGLRDRILNHFNKNHNGNRNGNGLSNYINQKDLDEDGPFVSIQLPFYNEKNVARRIIDACIAIDYKNYEILVLDDSRDETIEILKEISRRREPPTIKFVHRKDRRGFKGGALAEAVRHMDPRTEYIAVFDADFIPPPDIIKRFLWYFDTQNVNHANENGNSHRFADNILNYFNNKQNNGLNGNSLLERVDEWYERRKIAAVQGYQHHHLNKSENWITKGVRAEYSGSYMIERAAEEFFGAMKMISGSVFMLRAEVVKRLGWTTSITEDWDLTLRLYLAGYKVVYTPLIQAPAEIPTSVSRLARQRMRWAEGHTFAVKKYFWNVITSRMLTFREKLEFLYFAPYYLQSFFFLVGTVCWMIGELLRQTLPFWTATLGWCLILSNLFSLPMMSLAGLFLERNAIEDFTGIFSFIILSYVLTPFQAYAALMGLFEKEEGTWIRTLKTGTITDKVLEIRFRTLFSWILPERRRRRSSERRGSHGRSPSTMALLFLVLMSSLIVWVTVSAISEPVVTSEASTALTFEYEPDVVVNGIETDRILTHPDHLGLGSVPHIDEYATTSEDWNLAWSFYLYGPLEQKYRINGCLVFELCLYASDETEVDIKFEIRDVDPEGNVKDKVSIHFEDVELDESSPSEPVSLTSDAIKSKKFKKNHTILVEIWLKSDDDDEEITYYFEYDSEEKNSQIDFPGIVMPESVLPLFLVAPLIPVAVLKARKRRDERC